MERSLIAILAADVVGFSRLMGADETGTFERLGKLQTQLMNPTIAQHNGRIVKLMGDGYLVEFASVVDATACAVDIQRRLDDFEPEVNGDDAIQLRIGLNFGDVIREDDDIYGNGVNIAARLEALADPGGICLSGKVYDEVATKLDLQFECLGERQVKNIAEPVRTFRVKGFGTPSARVSAQLAQHTCDIKPAIAVLPFHNMSSDPDQDYFSDGLTEDIITALSQWRSVPVIDRNSAFSYKGQTVPVRQVAEELGVQYVMEGSVRKAGPRLRITAQLVNAETGHHVWAEKFDRQLEDIFDVQDEITNHIASLVVPEVESFENSRRATKRTEDLNAWDLYLQGMATFHDDTCPGTFAAAKKFQAAVTIDPDYGDAWARLGWCRAKQVMFACTDEVEQTLADGFDAAHKAVALDPASALAHVALGTVHIWAEETEQGLAEALQAVELNPNFALAAMAAGNRLDLVGRTDEGIQLMKHALKLNPRDPNCWRYMAYLSRAYISLDEYEVAADWAKQAVTLRPDLPEAQFRAAVSLAHLDQVEEARTALEKCGALDASYVEGKRGWQPYPDAARNAHIMDGLRRHGLI